MKNFEIQIQQLNSNNEIKFSTTWKRLQAESVKDAALKVAEFSKDTFELTNYMKSNKIAGSSNGIKKSLQATLILKSDSDTLIVNVKQFGKLFEQSENVVNEFLTKLFVYAEKYS